MFSGETGLKPHTRSRRWRVNEMIYHERINGVRAQRKRPAESFFGVVKPFNLPTDPGVASYDTEMVEGGQFLTLLSNAKWVVDRQLRDALLKSGKFEHPPEYHQVKKENPRRFRTRFPGELWNPAQTAGPFEVVVMSTETPADDLLENAITHQFQVALQRDPTDEEMAKYPGFMKAIMVRSDSTSALKNMMVSVLMEPEFLYRNVPELDKAILDVRQHDGPLPARKRRDTPQHRHRSRRRYIRLPNYNDEGHKTLGNWYTTILNAYGNPIEHYGDFDVAPKVDQKGAINQFIS